MPRCRLARPVREREFESSAFQNSDCPPFESSSPSPPSTASVLCPALHTHGTVARDVEPVPMDAPCPFPTLMPPETGEPCHTQPDERQERERASFTLPPHHPAPPAAAARTTTIELPIWRFPARSPLLRPGSTATHGAAAPHAHTTVFEHSPHAPVSRLPANTARRSSTPSSDSFVVAVCVCRRRVTCPLCQICTTLRSWNPSPLHPRQPPTATVLYLSRHIPQSPAYLIIFCTRKIFQPFCCSPMRPHPPLRRRAASPSTRPLSS